jgi:GLPGLI family protein
MNIPKNDLAQRMNRIDAGGSKEYYYNDITKTYLIKECEALGECFIFENKYLNWELTQETKEINGYIVYKATRSNGKVIAWYTPSIPISFGPKGEYGLPGLILQLDIGNIVFSAVKIVLNPKEEIKIEIPKGGKRISGEEYAKEIKKAKKSVFGN